MIEFRSYHDRCGVPTRGDSVFCRSGNPALRKKSANRRDSGEAATPRPDCDSNTTGHRGIWQGTIIVLNITIVPQIMLMAHNGRRAELPGLAPSATCKGVSCRHMQHTAGIKLRSVRDGPDWRARRTSPTTAGTWGCDGSSSRRRRTRRAAPSAMRSRDPLQLRLPSRKRGRASGCKAAYCAVLMTACS